LSVLVIAEPGCTAEGDKATMLRLLETAHACGANVWKPQWTSDPVQMCERRHIGPDHSKRAYYEAAYRWLQWPVEWHAEFRDRCKALGMQYACSVYLPQDVATVAPFVDYLKISSFEAMDRAMSFDVGELLRRRRIRKPKILVSVGMQSKDERDECLDLWSWHRVRYYPTMLHCVSAYPAPLESLELHDIPTCGWGFSDHSRHLMAGAIAFARGAEVVETHYRLDTCHPSNPDYAVAFTPAEFTQYIQNIRDAETMMGTGEKRIQECEKAMLPFRVTA
jgi:N,N'-diacetyllegionaminate synthase